MGGFKEGVDGWMGGQREKVREKVRGEYGFSSLMKPKKKAKITLSFASQEKKFIILYL